MSARQTSRKKTSGGAGCLIWIALLLVICLLFVLNKGRIEKVLNNTNFVNLWQSRSASPRPSPAPSPRPSAAPSARASAQPSERPSAAPERSQRPEPSPRQSPAPERSKKPDASPRADRSPQPSAGAGAKPKTRIATICLMHVEDDGTPSIREVSRSLPASDSPLLDALNALAKGPSADEMAKGLMSFIPQGTKVLSVTIRGSTAMVNFNEAFQFNPIGVEGYAGQLKQVVWTATAFPTVHDVQILIEGKKMDFLGGDGVYIGLPRSRNSEY